MYDEDDYYDDEDGEGYDTTASIQYIRSKLGKSVNIADDFILAKLELNNWDEAKALKAIKSTLPKPASGAGAGKATPVAGKQAAPASSKPATTGTANKPATSTTTQSSSSKSAASVSSSSKATDSKEVDTIFTKAEAAAEDDSVTNAATVPTDNIVDLVISDDETVPVRDSSAPLGARTTAGAHGVTDSESKPELTMIVVGHVDAGKSTLVGNLLHKLGKVTQKVMHKNEKEAKAIGKGSFTLAWVMDERKAERERGVTIDIAERTLSTSSRNFTILDAPGHRDFVPNMIKGAAQADVALLVVPATSGEYETCMSAHAQTREHAALLKALGVNQVVIVVNKMDSTSGRPWNQERYHHIEAEVRNFLVNDLNFHDKLVRCLPLSGLTGDNLITMSNECPGKAWYHGITLQAALDTFHIPPKHVDKAFRAVVTESKQISKNEMEMQVIALQGKIRKGRSIGIASYSNQHCKTIAATVSSIKSLAFETEMGISSEITMVSARERATLRLVTRQSGGFEFSEGDEIILFKGPPQLKPVTSFRASITTMNVMEVPIIPGSKFQIYLKGIEMQCVVAQIESVAGGSKKPKCVPCGKNAIVTISVEHSTVVEPFNTCRALGRFALRFRGSTIAVGSCEDSV